MAHWTDSIKRLKPCNDALEWLKTQSSAQIAWDTCERSDWMLWYAGKLSGAAGSYKRRRLVLAACACARTVLHLIPSDENRPREAIETAESWAWGNGATLEDVQDASASAFAASAYASADNAASAASAASASAYATADAVSKKAKQKECADIVRKFYPLVP